MRLLVSTDQLEPGTLCSCTRLLRTFNAREIARFSAELLCPMSAST